MDIEVCDVMDKYWRDIKVGIGFKPNLNQKLKVHLILKFYCYFNAY